jgi:hypothetical protein
VSCVTLLMMVVVLCPSVRWLCAPKLNMIVICCFSLI